MNNRIGQQIGNFRLSRLLGQGGFAAVYLGEHIYLKTHVALKFLHGRLSEQDVQDFMQEAQTLANLKHPHIMHVSDFGLDGGMPYIVMDYAPHGSLRDRYPRGNIVPLPQVLLYVKQVGAALTYTHEHKLIHCDVKPENMLLDEHKQILLSDFGIVAVAHSTTSMHTQNSIGTVQYMAPEQLRGRPTPASDQYSLGIVVYEWLCGVRPFRGANFIEIGMKHVTEPVPSLRQKNPALSPDVEQVVLKALAKDERQRFAHVQDFVHALEQVISNDASTTVGSGHAHAPQLSRPSNLFPMQRAKSAIQSFLSGAQQSFSMQPSTLSTTNTTSPRAQVVQNSPQPGKNRAAAPGNTVRPIGTLLLTYTGHQKKQTTGIEALHWSPDSRRLVSISHGLNDDDDDTLHVWDGETGHKEFTAVGRNPAWSPNAKHLITELLSLQKWDTTTWKEVPIPIPATYGKEIAYSPNGTCIFTLPFINPKGVNIYASSTGKLLTQYREHDGRVNTAVWSPTNTRIASVSDDSTVHVWDATNGKKLFEYKEMEGRWVKTLAWSHDGRYLACGGADSVHIWNVITLKTVQVYQQHAGNITALSWSPDSQHIASASYDGTVRIWRASDGTDVYLYKGHRGVVEKMEWSPDGTRIASGDRNAIVHIWQANMAAGIENNTSSTQ